MYKKVQKSLTRCLREGLVGETVAAVSTPVLAEDAIFPAEGNERVKERPGCYLVINKVSRDYDATKKKYPPLSQCKSDLKIKHIICTNNRLKHWNEYKRIFL